MAEAKLVKTYPNGQTVRLSLHYTDGACTPVDPDDLTLKLKAPDDTVQTLVYLTDAEIVRDDVGEFHADIAFTMPGTWHYRWEGTGQYAGVLEWRFIVEPTAF